jgi:hypothetical protein
VKKTLKRYHKTVEILNNQTFWATATSTALLFHVHQFDGKSTRKIPKTSDKSMPAFAVPDVTDRSLGWNLESTTLFTNALM